MSQFVELDIPQGRLRGKRVTSSTNGVTYYSFQGVPYAKPPVGPLRFKPPEDPVPWTGIRDATVEGAVAPQVDFFTKKMVGDEDCLFLNVYTPQWPVTSPKAVMVWIHGGAFFIGSGNTDLYGPDFLVAEDVVLVTINYRLGVLGFLHLDGADVTGNNGLRDQVMALKWVKNNIANFGGDPDNVTIFGESAGGVSVHYLVLSPLAEGLFHRVIAQSGTVLLSCGNASHDICSQRAVRLAKALGCTSEEPQLVADFLRTVPAEQFVTHRLESLSGEERERLLDLPFFPSEEVGPEAFLPDSPRNLLNEGRYNKVQFMTGVTSAEGKVMLMDLFLHTKLSEFDKKFENVLPPDLVPKTGTARGEEIAALVKKYYFGDGHVSDDTTTQFTDMMSDLIFVYPMHKTVQSQIKWSPHPTYVYLFDHMIESGMNFLTGTIDKFPGVPHGAELMYLFHASAFSDAPAPGPTDTLVRQKCVQLWTQFAKTGNPSREDITWTPAEKGNQYYRFLNINGGFNMNSNMYKQRMDFVEELYSKFLPRVVK